MPTPLCTVRKRSGSQLSLELRIPGRPVPLSRTGHGQFGGKYLSAPTSRQIGIVVDAWERAGARRFADAAPLDVRARFYFERPAFHFGTGRNAGKIKDRFSGAVPTGRPDIDNLVKLILEALQGNAFKDDSRVVMLRAEKRFSNRARTEVWIHGERE